MTLLWAGVWAGTSAVLGLAIGRMMGHIRAREATLMKSRSRPLD